MYTRILTSLLCIKYSFIWVISLIWYEFKTENRVGLSMYFGNWLKTKKKKKKSNEKPRWINDYNNNNNNIRLPHSENVLNKFSRVKELSS